MSEALHCPCCGKSIPLDAPQGLCPACLLEQGLTDAGRLSPQAALQAETETIPPHSLSVASASSETATAAPISASIPGYEILAELGRGGMGVVYKARQTNLNRLVALKMILAGGHASAADLARFKTEAEAIGRLQHPNIVQVFEVGEHEGKAFFSLEYCDGGSLAEKLNGTPLSPQEAAVMVETLARAMAAAHQKGIIHRDLKPANVLLAQEGTPKITDFGLAKKLDDVGQTATGAIMGTPSYMAPEQAEGKGKELGPPTDIYALGAILYECLTGRPPFKAATPLDTVLQVVSDEPVPPRQLQPKTPKDLETICVKCLHKEPARRYTTALELAEDLRRFQAGEPIIARPVGKLERLVKWMKRRPAAAALLIVLVLGSVFSSVMAAWALGERNDAVIARTQAEADKLAKEEQLLRAQWLVYAGKINLAQREWEANNVKVAWALLDECRPDFRSWEYGYLSRLFRSNQRTIEGRAGSVVAVAFRPDGKRLASAFIDGPPIVWDLETGKAMLSLVGHQDIVDCVAYSPDGKYLATGSRDKTAKVWDAATGKELHTLKGHRYVVGRVAFSGDGRRLASADWNGMVIVWNTQTGDEALVLRKDAGSTTHSVAYSMDGRYVASHDGREIKIWDTKTGKEVAIFKGHTNTVMSVAFSRDGARLASGSYDKTIRVWDLQTGANTLTLRGHTEVVNGVAFDSDGQRLVSASGDHTVRIWDANAGDEIVNLRGHADEVHCVTFSPDGKSLASGSTDRTIKIWDTQTRQEDLTLRKDWSRAYFRMALSPDGNYLALPDERQVHLLDARTGQEMRTIDVSPGYVSDAAFGPEGALLVSERFDEQGKTFFELKLWDTRSGKQIRALGRYPGNCPRVAFSPDGTRVACPFERTVKVWDAQSGREILTLRGHTGQVTCVAFSRDGRLVSAGEASLDVVEKFDVEQMLHVGEFKVWDLESATEVSSFRGHESHWPQVIQDVAFSHDGAQLATASLDKTVKVWDVESGKELLTLRGHTEKINSLAFNHDGKRLASGSDDRTVKIWDTLTGTNTLTLRQHARAVGSVTFGPDGKRLMSAGQDGTVRIWDATPR